VLAAQVDILIPAAVSYAITAANADDVAARVVVEAANTPVTLAAEGRLAVRGIPVIPDFVANAGAVAWAWWLLLGRVDADPIRSFSVLREEMLSRIAPLLSAWDAGRITPRTTALNLADWQAQHNQDAEADGSPRITIP
jgi:glutamate dehydrogenase (NAD(P)+)